MKIEREDIEEIWQFGFSIAGPPPAVMFVRSLEGSGHGGMKGGEEERRARSQREERRVIHVIYTVAASISHARRHLEEGKRGGGAGLPRDDVWSGD